MYGNGLENSVRFTLPFHSSWLRLLNAIREVAVKLGNLLVSHRGPLHNAGNVGTISFKGNGRCRRMLLRAIMKYLRKYRASIEAALLRCINS